MAWIQNTGNITSTLGRIVMTDDEKKDQEERLKLEQRFIVRLTIDMKNILINNLSFTYEDHETQSRMFFNLMVNFIAASVTETSAPDKVASNIHHITSRLNQWVTDNTLKYDDGSVKNTPDNINKGLH